MGYTLAKWLVAIPAMLAVLVTPAANAAFVEDFLGVSIVIDSECLITAIDPLDFSNHGVITGPITAQTTIDVHCTTDTAFEIGLDKGTGGAATIADRLLSNTITYSLYSDSGHANVWGDVAPDTVTGDGDGDAQTFDIFGLVPFQTTPIPGNYSDSVKIIVTY